MGSLHAEAIRRGAHEECWTAGPTRACPDCKVIVMRIMGELYNGVPADEVRSAVSIDLQLGNL